jgi:hypothetical protein
MILNPLKNTGSADSILVKLGQLIPFQERAKEQGRVSGWITLGAPGERERCTQHSGAVKQMINGELTVLVPILMDVAYSIMYDISSQNFNSRTVFNGLFFNDADSFLPPREPVLGRHSIEAK